MPLLGLSYFWSYDCLDAVSGVPTLFVEGNKIDVFALKNMGVVDFVVWIFFCKFVDCV